MIGYHGTTKENALLIIKDGILEKTSVNNSIYGIGKDYFKTSEGFVYIATNIAKALDFGVRALNNKWISKGTIEKVVIIFKIKLKDDENVYIDEDEVNLELPSIDYKDKIKIINSTQSFCIKRNLAIKSEVISYTCFEFDKIDELYRLMETDLIENQLVWYEL